MAVTSMLALAPLIRNDIIDTEHIIVDSKIGSSGAHSSAITSPYCGTDYFRGCGSGNYVRQRPETRAPATTDDISGPLCLT